MRQAARKGGFFYSLKPAPGRSASDVPEISGMEAWIAAREAKSAGLKPGVEAGIVWADPSKKQKTDVSIIYLPGYTATRGEVYPVPDRIAAALGANLFYARPTGQGMGPDAHKTVTASDWVSDGIEAFEIGRRLGDRVVVMATSTGATVAVWQTLGPSRLVPAASLLISPNLTPLNRQTEMLLWPGAEWLLGRMMGETMSLEPRNDLQAQFWDLTHHSHSLIPMMQLVAGARKQDFGRWPTPVLVVYDPQDTVVDEAVTVKLFSKMRPELCEFLEWTAAEGDDHHVLAGEALSPGGTDRMSEAGIVFLKRVLGL